MALFYVASHSQTQAGERAPIWNMLSSWHIEDSIRANHLMVLNTSAQIGLATGSHMVKPSINGARKHTL